MQNIYQKVAEKFGTLFFWEKYMQLINKYSIENEKN